MSLSFLGKKSFHPSNPKNLQKLYAAEEKKKADEKKKAELEEQFKIDRDRAELRSLRRGGETLQDGEMGFMYQAPPGFQEAQARDQRRHKEAAAAAEAAAAEGEPSLADMRRSGGGERTVKEIDEARFAILKNAPRKEGEATADVRVKHNVFAVQLRNVRCTRCGAWGHQATDRECPMRDSQGARDEAQKARDDPMARHTAAAADAEPLRWELKGSAVGAGVHGGGRASDANQQFVVDPDDEAPAAAAAAAGAADIDPALLAALSEKQQRKLLKMYRKALAGGGDGGGDGDGGGGKKRKKEKHKKEKKKRRRSESRSRSSSRN